MKFYYNPENTYLKSIYYELIRNILIKINIIIKKELLQGSLINIFYLKYLIVRKILNFIIITVLGIFNISILIINLFIIIIIITVIIIILITIYNDINLRVINRNGVNKLIPNYFYLLKEFLIEPLRIGIN